MIEMKHVCAGYREKEILHDELDELIRNILSKTPINPQIIREMFTILC